MTENVTMQSDWVAPAVNGAVVVISVDGTSREYDLSTIAFGLDFGEKPNADFYVDASADGNAVYYTVSSASGKTVDDTAAMAAGGAVAFTANACQVIFASTTKPLYYNRTTHRYLQVKCASGQTAKLRLNVSSCLRPGDM
jgi:hypothetical protein